MVIKTNLRYAHSEGFISIFWSATSKQFFTCGLDGEIRIWEDFENDDPTSHTVAEQATAICLHEEKIFVADEAGYIRTFLLPDYVKDGFVTKFNEHVTHVTINKSGEHILACSRDFSIKWVNVNDNSQNIFGSVDGHTAPVLSVALDPKEEFFASSSCDGFVKIWRLDDSSKPSRNLHILDQFNDISCSRPVCRLHWHPKNGEILAIPVKTGVELYGRNTWNLIKSLQNDTITEAFSVCCFSPCGKYLAASAVNGQIIVWDYVEEKIIFIEQHVKKQAICELIWHPLHADRLIYCDTNGHVGVIKEICKLTDDTSNPAKSPASRPDENYANSDEYDDDDIGAIKSKYNSQIFVDDEDDDDLRIVQNGARPLAENVRLAPAVPSWKPKPVQQTFVVGSTPESLTERFMKWNSIGIVRQFNTDEECIVDVEFHDASTYHSLQIDNSLSNYSMADLSAEALALCSNGSEENKFKSRLYVLHFGSWDSSRDWSSELPNGENICCLCLGSGWVAVGSTRRTVWIFSVAGVQLRNFTLAGSILTMAGCGNILLVTFQDGLDADGVTNVSCLQYRNPQVFSGGKKCDAIYFPLTLSLNSELSWLGFSVEETPCSCDSDGIVRLLINSTWVQIFDWKQETKSESDFLWITSVHECLAQIRAIRCKHSKFPPILPRPVVNVFSWRFNSCDQNADKTAQEEKFFGANLKKQRPCIDDEDRELFEKAELESILKLFLLACNAERDCRALEVANLADSTTTLNALINVATKKGRTVLAEKVADLARRRVAAEHLELSEPEFTRTQQLFPDEEDEPAHHNGYNTDSLRPANAAPPGENPLRRNERSSTALDFIPPANGLIRNPFKRNSANEFNDASDKKAENGRSIFDNLHPTLHGKRQNDLCKLNDELLENEPTKKKKTLIVKKQSKLSFGRQCNIDSLITNVVNNGHNQAPTNGLELFKKENNENLSQNFESVSAVGDSSLSFNEFADRTFYNLPEDERENWNKRALSLLEKLEKNESKRKISLDSFAFSD